MTQASSPRDGGALVVKWIFFIEVPVLQVEGQQETVLL